MDDLRIVIEAGPHDRRWTPLTFALPPGVHARAAVDEQTGQATALGLGVGDDGRPTGHLILDRLAAAQTRVLRLDPDAKPRRSRAVFMRQQERRVDVMIGGKRFTSYHCEPTEPRPYFWPLAGPHGVNMTRAFPMAEIDGEAKDHPHHRSLWVAFGDVNGTDNWSQQPGHAWQAALEGGAVCSTATFGQFTHALQWQDRDRKPVMSERRHVRLHATPADHRLIDLTIAFTAEFGPVRFGDTKEGGICSVRVATSMDANKGGRIENSAGGIGEAETWGKPAHWCDYSGPVASRHVGIAIFDHPMNLRHPTPWHVRDYGLMTANPFGYSHYKSGLLTDGSYTIETGQTLTFRYRVFIHNGDARRGAVAHRYHDYVHPPKVTVRGA